MATPTIQNNYVGDGSTVLYSFTFPYINISDVVVTVDGTAQVIQAEYFFANATTIQFVTAPADGAAILIRRYTASDDVAAVFFPGSAIRARDLNDNFVQSLYVAQESTVTSQDATDSSADAQAAAEAAQAAADSAASDAADALVQANAAGQSASEAQASASDAQALASSAAVSAQEAAASAADASSDAASAIATADGAVVVANAADAKADTAIADSAAAVVTANQSKAESSQAISTADGADAKADTAIGSANSAVVTANNALSAANTAETNSNQAKQDAAAAIEAVSEALLYTLVQNVASIPSSPGDGDAVEVIDSTGIESFTPLTGLPAGFVGNSELFVRILYSGSASSWSFISYNASSPEDRYVTRSGDNMTGDLTLGTDKVVLNASDGSITAAGNVVVGDTSSENYVRTYSSGQVRVVREVPTGDPSRIFSGFQVGDQKVDIRSDGQAAFAGKLEIGVGVVSTPTVPASPNISLKADGTITTRNGNEFTRTRSNGTSTDINLRSDKADAATFWQYYNGNDPSDVTYIVRSNGNVEIGGNLSLTQSVSSPNISLNANGSATFAGNITAAGNINSTSDGVNVASITSGGVVESNRTNANGTAISVRLNSNQTALIRADGSATFAGDVQVAGDPNAGVEGSKLRSFQVSACSSPTRYIYTGFTEGSTTPTFTVTADGSASFAGDIYVGESAASTTQSGSYIGVSGQVVTNNVGNSPSTDRVFLGKYKNAATSEIKADGSATFSGDVNALALKANRANASDVVFEGKLNGTSGVRINANGDTYIGGTITSAPNITLNATDGSATFAGGVSSAGFEASYSGNSPNSYKSFKSKGMVNGALTETFQVFADGSASFAGNVTANNVTFNLEADDDTKYTSTTDSEGNETRVYNGAVLDVKDRIQNVLARMDAIEANEITDDATDSALLTLIASLSARLDERDAAIAALTARVEELEEA